MKLASLKKGGRDGTLVVLNKKMTLGVTVSHIAPTMQIAVERWGMCEPQLKEIYNRLNLGEQDGAFPVSCAELASPLPRAYQWADGSAYVTHVELVRKSRGAVLPEEFWTDPLMYQGGSDSFIGPCDPIEIETTDWGIDYESEIAVITDDVPMGVSAENAVGHIKMLMLVNDVSLRKLIPGELAKGFGFFHGKPATAFSPVAVSPEELGSVWRDTRVHLPLKSYINGELFGEPEAGVDMTFNFAQLIAHAAKSRHLEAGTIIGSGTVANASDSVGSSCLMERRMREAMKHGEPRTDFLQFGDTVRIEMLDADGENIFGSIDQTVKKYVTVENAIH